MFPQNIEGIIFLDSTQLNPHIIKIYSNEIVQLYDKIILKIKTLVDPNPKGKNAKKKDEKPTEIDKKFIG